jgi:hypothetical protein
MNPDADLKIVKTISRGLQALECLPQNIASQMAILNK